ncbi:MULTISPECIES: hypothetical protein [Arthrobacter]|uniref:DUF1648 domain-containing protein n=2 Tax=Arthrobacter TaxID=1663 RepID=A0ABU9KHH1_9MICC|nr:hypothetical protein [Arthrobacter sp. YJM1]MDP5225647.1 hypothetical protein [Arthrobacter sp. YJM1]
MDNAEEDETRRRRDGAVDWRTLRFAVGFPVLVALAFLVSARAVAQRLPSPLAFRWEDSGGVAFTDLPSYLALAMTLIVVPSLPFLIASGFTTLPVIMRRIMLSVGISLSLFLCTAAAAGLAGQLDLADARQSHVDGLVLLLGTGGSLGLGILVHYVYRPDPQWDPRDDRALRREMESLDFPELAAVESAVWARPRTSVLVMTGLLGVFPAAFLSILSPWIGLVLVLVALCTVLLLLLRITVRHDGLRLKLGGVLPVARLGPEDIFTAESAMVRAADYGGWGPRHGDAGRSFLVASGPAVVVSTAPVESGRRLVFSAPTADAAELLAAALRSLSTPRGEGRAG